MRALFFGVLLTLTGYAHAQPLVIAGSDADVAAILDQSRAFSAAYVRGDVEALVGIYAEDGIAAPSGRDFIRGQSALLDFWQLGEGVNILEHQAAPEELRVSGDLAYDWGYYSGRSQRGDAEAASFRGKYLIVWQRDPDGVWRIAHDMWNALPQD